MAADELSTWCIIFACSAGLVLTLAAVVVAYPSQQALQTKQAQTVLKRVFYVVCNLILTGCGIGLQALSVRNGPVAVATPISIGVNLLSNMVLQTLLGIANYTKNMIVGTMVLAAAVAMLTGVGPGDVPADTPVMGLLFSPLALLYIFGLMAAMAASGWFLYKGSTVKVLEGLVNDNVQLIFLYALIGSGSTVLNTAITKVVQMPIPHVLNFAFLALYVALAVIGLGVSAKANGSLEDPSLFVPLSSSVQLVLTCLSGLCIWGDWERLEFRLCYAMVYILVVLGSYLVGSADSVAMATPAVHETVYRVGRKMTMAHDANDPFMPYSDSLTLPLKGVDDNEEDEPANQPMSHCRTEPSPNRRVVSPARRRKSSIEEFREELEDSLGFLDRVAVGPDKRAVDRLLEAIRDEQADEYMEHAFKECLKTCVRRKAISEDAIVDLCWNLLGRDQLRSAYFDTWLRNRAGAQKGRSVSFAVSSSATSPVHQPNKNRAVSFAQ